MTIGTVAVLGPGGVGGLLAAALHRAGEPILVVAREQTAQALNAEGISVRSEALGAWTARPPVVTALDEPVDALLVATKALGLSAALERVAADSPALVAPLLNGLEHVAAVRRRFGSRACVASVRVESDRPRTGVIVHTSPGIEVALAHDDRAHRPALHALADRLSAAGVSAQVAWSEAQVLWAKMARLCPIACTTTAFDRTMGEIRADSRMREALEGCVREAAAVARAEGAAVSPEGTLAEIDALHPGLGSSMRRDLAAGREPELDAIAGALLRAGLRHGLSCPTITELAARIAARAGIAALRVAHPA